MPKLSAQVPLQAAARRQTRTLQVRRHIRSHPPSADPALDDILGENLYGLQADPSQSPAPPPSPRTPAAAQRRCPSCNAKVSEGAAICINCGSDVKTGKKLQTKREAPVFIEGAGGGPSLGMQLLRAGLILHLLAVIISVVSILLPIGAVWIGDDIIKYIDYTSYGIAALQIIGTLLCLGTPKESGGRLFLILTIALALASGVAEIFAATNPDTVFVGLIAGLLSIGAVLSFLMFFVQLARYLDFPEITDQAEKVFGVYLIVLIGSLGMFAPCFGCIIAIIVLGAMIYGTFLYIQLLIDLNRAVAYRINNG